jgi:hypothetical protein
VVTPQARQVRPRIWHIWIGVAVAVVLACVAVFYFTAAMSTQALPQAPALTPTQKPAATQQATETPTSSPTPVISIAGSPVTQIYVPSDNPDDVINSQVYPMPTSCQNVIEPPESGQNFQKVFQCTDFAMPGTATATNAVVAGHSSKYITTVFNRLYAQGASLIGKLVYIRTQASGDHWLVYKVQNVYEPLKTELPYMEQIWAPTEGRLIIVTCLQDSEHALSVRNFIVVTQFQGVQ